MLKALYPTGQPARSAKVSHVSGPTPLEMAQGSCLRRSPHQNPPLVDSVDDELDDGPPGASTESSGSMAPTSQVSSRAPTLGPTPAPNTSVGRYTDEDLQKATKLALESFLQGQEHAQRQAGFQVPAEPRERPLKARFPDLYFGNSHLDRYRFCQQCEDHFKTARATGSNRVCFAASFLRGMMT